ncbi:MAG: tetratricopeptide repeat protein [Methylococcaceae bacterium]
MSRKKSTLYLLVFLLLSGCGGNAINKSNVILEAESHTQDGLKKFSQANWHRAHYSFTQALLFYQGIDDQQGVLLSHINLAEVALVLDDYSTVEKHLQLATIIANRTSQVEIQSRIALLFSQNAVQQKQIALAKNYLQPLLLEFNDVIPVRIASRIELVAIADRTKIAFIENSSVSLWTHRYANALLHSDIKDSVLETRLLRFQAALFQRQGDLEAAESNLQQALTQYKNNFSRLGIALTLTELAELYLIQGRAQDANEYLNRAMDVFRYLKDTEKIAQLNEALAKLKTEKH